MKNNTDQAEIDAILSGGRREVDRYLVTGVHRLTITVEEIPGMIALAIAEHQSSCRSQSRRQLVGIASAIGAVVGLLTPYVIHAL